MLMFSYVLMHLFIVACAHQLSEPTKPQEVQNTTEKSKKKEKPKGQAGLKEVGYYKRNNFSSSSVLLTYRQYMTQILIVPIWHHVPNTGWLYL